MTDAPPSPDVGPDAPFAAPWQAEAFACAVELSRKGLYAWTEWVEVFSAEIAARPAQPDESDGDAYYRQWLAALETLVRRKGATSAAELDARRERWREAYLRTPHGQPVELSRVANGASPAAAAAREPHCHHETPVAVSPASR
ncbi:MAG: nitrile hydratase accessory protein [Steroidobacteraceae bacterium]